jgi:hypothetical protein
VRLSFGSRFLFLYLRKHAGGAAAPRRLRETDSMRRKATPQTLLQQQAIAAQATSTAEPERPEFVSEPAACEDIPATSDNHSLRDPLDVAPVVVPEASPFSSLAATLKGDRAAFLQVLDRAVDGGIAAAAGQALPEGAGDLSDESAVFQNIVVALVAGRSPLTAVVVGSALAARTVAHSLFQSEDEFDTAAAEALLLAWLDAARALLKLRGAEGLLRLVPAARNLARRAAAHRDVAPAVADAMRRVAARIADAEHSLTQAPRPLPQRKKDGWTTPEVFDTPKRVVIHGQMQLIFHER